MAVRVEIEDFVSVADTDIQNVNPSVIFRDPSYFDLRVKGITRKFAINTGLPEHMFEILDLHISSVNFNIAWVKFSNEEIVRSIFRNSAIIQSNKLNIFPVIPSCGIDRKKAIERVLKEVQKFNSNIRYQIRLGERDFKIFMKVYIKGE